MAEALSQEFLDLLKQPATDAVQAQPAGAPAPKAGATVTQEAFDRLMGLGGQLRLPPKNATDIEAVRMGARPNVPLDMETGIPLTTQLNAEWNRRQSDQIAEYEKTFGKGNVVAAPDGSLVIRNIMDPKTGQVSDVRVHPSGFGADDLVTLATSAPEVVAGFLAARSGNTSGAWGAVRALAQMAGATEAAGAGKDIATRLLQGHDIEPGEIALSRSGSALADLATGGVLAGATGLGGKIISPFANPGPEQQSMRQAMANLLDKWGIKLSGTPGQLSGSGLLLRTEAQIANLPGSAGVVKGLLEKDDAAIRQLQARFLGLPANPSAAELAALPSNEQVGERALGQLGAQTAQAENAVTKARQAVQQTGTQEVGALMGTGTGTVPINTTTLGGAMRQSTTSQFDAFKKAMSARYEAFFNEPALQDKNFDASGIATDAARLVKSLPAKTVTETKPTGLLDAQGNPIYHTTTGQEVLPQFMPKGIKDKLFEMAGWKGQSFRLDELKQVRTAIDDAIAEGTSIPGTDTGMLKRMRGIVSGGIEEGLDKLNNPTLKSEWQALNQDYANGITRFEPAPIRRMLIAEEEKGAVGNTALAESAMGNSPASKDVYDAYKSFYGPTSPHFGALKQAIAENVFGSSLDTSREFISGSALLGNLNKIRPDVAQDVFGASQPELRKIAQSTALAQGELPVDAVRNLQNSGSLTYQKLVDLRSAEAAKDQLYRNQVLNAVAKGNEGIERIKPFEFVARAIENPKVDVENELKPVLAMLSHDPELLQQIRMRTALNIFEKAAAKPGEGPLAGRMSASGILTAMPKEQETRYRTVLGNDVFDGLMDVARFLGPREQAFKSFASAGGLSAGSQIAAMFQHGELKTIPAMMKNMVLASLYVAPPIRKYVANTAITPANALRVINTVVASTPFVEAMRSQIGQANAEVAMDVFHDYMDRAWNETYKQPQGAPLNPAFQKAAQP